MKMVVGHFCGRCRIAKQTLMEKGYKFKEIACDSEEGKDIIDKTQAKELPILIDNGSIFSGQEVIDFANKAKKVAG